MEENSKVLHFSDLLSDAPVLVGNDPGVLGELNYVCHLFKSSIILATSAIGLRLFHHSFLA